MAIADKLTQLNNVKLAIKEKLQSKLDLNLSSTAFTDYATQIDTITNRGAVTKTFTPSGSSQSYTIPKGYHNGNGKVTCNAIGSGYIDLSSVKFLYAGSNGSSGSVTIGSGKQVIAIVGVQDYYSSSDANSSIKFTIGSTTYTCSTSNGGYTVQNQYRGNQKATRTMIWINNGSYKTSTFASATFTGGWGDGVNQLFVLYK